MIRTRDFFLYVLALFFVILAATYTGFSQTVSEELRQLVRFGTPAESVPVVLDESTDSRAARLAAMRDSLAAGEGLVPDAPPEFESVDQKRAAEAASTSATNQVAVGTRVLQYCSAPQPSPLLLTWPVEAELRLSEGEWTLFETVSETITVGTTTETKISQVPYVSLPIRSVRTRFESCLPDTLIGVTTIGAPLLNTSAAQYAGSNSSTLVGYTRDGFSVYGPLSDETVLDACGGYYANGRYQYHVRVSEDFILGCYAGIPVVL